MRAHFSYSGTTLKGIACFTMLLDHIGAACLQNICKVPYVSLLSLFTLSAADYTPQLYRLIVINTLLRSIGRLAFPIFAFLLVEGAIHTAHKWRYLGRLFLFGLLSEPIFDLVFFGTAYYPSYQNVYATLALGLLGIYTIQHWQNMPATSPLSVRLRSHLLLILILVGLCYTAEWLHTDYGMYGLLLMFALYLMRQSRFGQLTCVALLTLDQFPASFAVLPLAGYNQTRGKCSRAAQYAFYAFYLLHLAVLFLVQQFLLALFF